MGLIKWLNRHVFTSIVIYFALMVGVGWTVNQSIADRTALEVMPADDDDIAIYDTDAGTGKSIAVSTFRGDNLNAIVNAATGVTDPVITMYDSSSAAGTADIYGTSTGSYDVVMSLGVEDSSSATGTDYIQLNGTTETVDVLKPLTAPIIDGGTYLEIYSSDDSIGANVCEKVIIQANSGDAQITVTLPADGECTGVAGYAKHFVFQQRDADDGDELLIDVNGVSDAIHLDGTNCGAGDTITCQETGSAVEMYGYEGTNTIWFAITLNGTCACD